MNYRKEKATKELQELNDIFESLHKNWKLPEEDHENLFKIRVNLFITASIIRLYKPKNFTIEALRDIKYNEDTEKLLFSKKEILLLNNISFQNKVRTSLSLEDVCNYLIHDAGSYFTDNKKINGENFDIFYCVYTDDREEIMFNILTFIESVGKLLKKS